MSLGKIIAMFNKYLSDAGTKNGHKFPSTKSNTGAIVRDYHIAHVGEKFFAARKETAQRMLDDLYADKMKQLIPGTTVTLFQDECYAYTAQQYAPSDRLDKTQLQNELRKMGWTAEKVSDLLKRCSKEAKGQLRRAVSVIDVDATEDVAS